jgi:hypothetical protein
MNNQFYDTSYFAETNHAWFNKSLGKNLYYFCFREKIEHFIARFRDHTNYLALNFSDNINSFEVGARLNSLEELEKFNIELFNKSKKYHNFVDFSGCVCGCNNCGSGSITVGLKRKTGFGASVEPFVHIRFKSNSESASDFMPFSNKILDNTECLSQGVSLILNELDRYYFCYNSDFAKNAFSKFMKISLNKNNFLFSCSSDNNNCEILESGENNKLAEYYQSLKEAVVYMKNEFNIDYNAISYREGESSIYYNNIFDPLINLFVVLPRDKPFINSKDTMFY